jgi:hypothetical protein
MSSWRLDCAGGLRGSYISFSENIRHRPLTTDGAVSAGACENRAIAPALHQTTASNRRANIICCGWGEVVV